MIAHSTTIRYRNDVWYASQPRTANSIAYVAPGNDWASTDGTAGATPTPASRYSLSNMISRCGGEAIQAGRLTAPSRPAARTSVSTGHNAHPMPIPKNISFVTFDVYGTLIDRDTGIYEAFAKEAARDGFEIDRATLLPLVNEVSREIEGGSYELYAEVLRRTAIEVAKRMEWNLEPSRSGFLPDSVQGWKPFKETNIQLAKLAKKYKLGLLSNIDDKLLGQTRRHIPADFDLVVTAQQVRSYKPELAHFNECARRMGGKRGWVHVAASHYHDVAPCMKQRVPVIWVNRTKETLDSTQRKPTAEVPNLKEAAKLLGVS
jgi:2-haloacid dehalogenase